ncbi:hypothetical protein K501DRAFT_243966 [Backusella circina FSU 941]|nr:hypothetical protein K501DRAFT_243966 [Backusella circina FSU 941]
MFSPVLKKSLATAAAGAAWLSTATVAFAEEQKKLSIYDEPEPKIVLVESPSILEEHVYTAQKYANDTLEEGKSQVNKYVEQYQQLENDVTNTVKNTIHDEEEIYPNLIYVGVAALAGTIIARNRNIVLRFLTSAGLATGTSYYLLPKTTHNVALHLERLEHKYPPLQEAHQQVNMAVDDARKQVDATLAQLRGSIDESTSSLRQQMQQSADELKEQVTGKK